MPDGSCGVGGPEEAREEEAGGCNQECKMSNVEARRQPVSRRGHVNNRIIRKHSWHDTCPKDCGNMHEAAASRQNEQKEKQNRRGEKLKLKRPSEDTVLWQWSASACVGKCRWCLVGFGRGPEGVATANGEFVVVWGVIDPEALLGLRGDPWGGPWEFFGSFWVCRQAPDRRKTTGERPCKLFSDIPILPTR